jgi:hypothetical protein
MSESRNWREKARLLLDETLQDRILTALLFRSNLTKAQFETLLVDQLGHDMANKRLTRDDMTELRRKHRGISRGAFNRTLRQARENVVEAIHTILLLGYSGLTESPSVAPFIEASERLKGQTAQLQEIAHKEPRVYQKTVDSLIGDLDEALAAMFDRKRDV